MTLAERSEIMDSLFENAKEIAMKKGKAYAGSNDSLYNFKVNAERLGLTKYQVWNVYFSKHVDSIWNAIKENPELPIDHSEGMTERIMDAINYLALLYCLIDEDFKVTSDKEYKSDISNETDPAIYISKDTLRRIECLKKVKNS